MVVEEKVFLLSFLGFVYQPICLLDLGSNDSPVSAFPSSSP